MEDVRRAQNLTIKIILIYEGVERAGIKGAVYRKTCHLPMRSDPRKLKKIPLEKTAQKPKHHTSTLATRLDRVNAPGILIIIGTDSHHYELLRADSSPVQGEPESRSH